MAKIKIEVRKPQYVVGKQKAAPEGPGRVAGRMPFFFQVLLLATYACSALALWFVFLRIRAI